MFTFSPLNKSKLLLLLFPLFFLQTSANSILSPNKPLPDGSTLISPSSIFELGFFSPGNSTNRYVGIWYHNFSTSTVLWVANRNSPVPDNSGSLAITASNSLAILDRHSNTLWSSKAASFSPNQSTANLLDTGNLVLSNSNNILWQSFDHPTDTYLPGMKVGLDLTTNVNQVFTSWSGTDDPSTGNFSLGVAPDQSTQIFIWEGGKPRWRSGRWDGQVFIGIQGMLPTYIYGFKLSNFEQEKKMYFFYTQFNSSHRYRLSPDGVERHLVWGNDTENWHQFWAQPISECEIYNRCGENAGCVDGGGGEVECGCLRGFELRGGSCMRRKALECERSDLSGELDWFYLMEGVKLPDFSNWDSGPANGSRCEEACLRNCSCKAYSFVTGIGCLTWGGELVDVHLFSSGGNDFYLRLAASEFG